MVIHIYFYRGLVELVDEPYFEKQKELVQEILENAKDNKDKLGLKDDGIKEIERLTKLSKSDTLGLKFKAALEEFSNILEPTGKIMCKNCKIKYDVNKISELTAKLRNDIVHDTGSRVFSPNDYARCGIALMTRAIYIIKLKESGVEDKKIILFLQDLFK